MAESEKALLVSQVMTVLSAKVKAWRTFCTSHPLDSSFGVPPAVKLTL